MTPVKIYLTESEKAQLKSAAKRSGLSVSSFVKAHLEDVWQNPPVLIAKQRDFEPRSRCIKIRLTETECESIRQLAGNQSMSSYARKLLLSGGTPINISIRTDDITAFDLEISGKLQHFQNVIDAMTFREYLLPQEKEKILSILREIRGAMADMSREAKNNRKAIRNAGLRWIRQEYRKQKEPSTVQRTK